MQLYFVSIKVEVLAFSPALMEVGTCLIMEVWILHNVCAYVGILYILVTGRREMKEKGSFMDMKLMS